jgi:hypothetical protein
MQYIVPAVPLLLLGGIVALVLTSALRGRVLVKRTPRSPRPKKVTLRVVSPDRMDADLQELIRKG